MDATEKLRLIRELPEAELRRGVLLPLLSLMGFHAPTETHGTIERGKDIVCFDVDKLGNRFNVAIVAKRGDLVGSVSDTRGVREVVYQVEQAFREPLRDLFGMREIQIDQVWIVTSGRVLPTAGEAVFGVMKETNLHRHIRIISGENLVQLVDRYFQSYWTGAPENMEQVKTQRDRVLQFCRELLLRVGASAAEVESIASALLHSPYPPSVRMFQPNGRITHASAYGVEVMPEPELYRHAFYSTQCGLISEQIVKAKKAVEYAGWEVEEALDNLAKTLAPQDPHEFLAEFDRRLRSEYPFHRGYGRAGDALSEMEQLEMGLRDVDSLIAQLRIANRLEWAQALCDSVAKLSEEVSRFVVDVTADEFEIVWYFDAADQSPTLRFMRSDPQATDEQSITTKHSLLVRPYHPVSTRDQHRVGVNDVLHELHYELRKYLDKVAGYNPDS